MEANQILPNYTFNDYLLWEGRWEIIHGIPYAMSPMPSPGHQRIANNIGIILKMAMNPDKCRCQVYQPIDLKISEHTVVNPDLLIVCKPIMKQFLDFPPALVVEIISPSSEMKDRNTKYKLYETFGIPYYVMVNPETKTVEIYRLNAAKKYEPITEIDSPLVLDPDCSIVPKWDDAFTE
ncbi:MAG: Uma2 family endonuclease [Saprospiraceae bacterium]|nr:Uma2 family endonuclease [Saprospiraceae bacterium]